ncbi:LANO_0E02828g1_1 [Lachancea nothofagi CBS 11611]|uniref:Signal recognition particle subunit SRP68 n=1 Tax=Lachancea nothofagi CBS 11611 TaxID=1266666 RepID=A0A1G4JQJ0_9SACH|nr:LANO_0E02828g1_1 [Lachancea nothofagi CBS 11611]
MVGVSKSHYSPLGATYGVRADQFLETADDFDKYHSKLNRKLQKLRHHCQLTTKDTKRYSAKEKYSKVTHEDYDSKNKLFGTLMLLHAERDLALAENLRLKARQRGSAKKSESKVVATRLKKARETCLQLLELTQNEQNPIVRAEYLIYQKLVFVSYLSFGKPSRTKNPAASTIVAKELSLVISALQFLESTEHLSSVVVGSITSQFDYLLRKHVSSDVSTSNELRSYIARQVNDNSADPLISLLSQNGFALPSLQEDVEMTSAVTQVSWRRFSAEVKDSKVAELISEAQGIETQELSQFSEALVKWQEALVLQKTAMEQKQNDDREESVGEDDEILMTYLQYNSHFTTIVRDDIIFNRLWEHWISPSKISKSLKLTKYKEIERIVHNLTSYLQDVMDLPGVYSDDTLMANLKLATVYYQLHLTAGCLASFYQGRQKYSEALALYIDGQKTLTLALENSSLDEPLPGNIINTEQLDKLQEYIKTSLKSVISLAEYEKIASSSNCSSLEPSLLEKLDKAIVPKDVSLKNLFPMRPIIRPVAAKPTLFDLAFNYITYDNQIEDVDHFKQAKSTPNLAQPQDQEQLPKKKGLFGLFGL